MLGSRLGAGDRAENKTSKDAALTGGMSEFLSPSPAALTEPSPSSHSTL